MLLLSLVLLLLSSLSAFGTASPIWRHIAETTQQVLSMFSQPQEPLRLVYEPSSYLDVRPDAVVLGLTTAEDAVAEYFFLPLGKSVQTHTTPELPLHPLTARINGAIDAEGLVVESQDTENVECAIHPAWNRTLNPGKKMEDFAIGISSRDGVVDFIEAAQPFWLGGREVEAYECW